MANGRATIVSKSGKNPKTPWLNNMMKSVGMAAKDAIKDIAPNVSEASNVLTGSTSAIIDTIRKTKNSNVRLSTLLKRNKYIKMFDDSVKTALDDLRTGNIYNQDRMMDIVTGADDGSKSSSSSGDGTTFGDDGAESSAVGTAISTTADAVYKMSDQVTKGISAQIKVQKASMDAMVAMNATMMQQSQQNYSQIINTLTNINSNLSAIVQYNNENMNKFINASMAYYEGMGKTFAKKDEKKSDKVTAADLFNSTGGLDFGNYKKYVKQQFKDTIEKTDGLSTIATLFEDENMLRGLFADPLGTATRLMIPNLMPKVLVTSLKTVEDTFNAFVPTMLSRIGELAETTGTDMMSTLKRMIGNTFGITDSKIKKFSKTAIERGPIPFDGETKHAITEVITKELRDQTGYLQIIANHFKGNIQNVQKHVRDNGEIFSFKDGEYYKQSDINKRISEEIHNSVINAMKGTQFGNSLYGALDAIKINNPNNSNEVAKKKKESAELTKVLNEFMYRMSGSRKGYNSKGEHIDSRETDLKFLLRMIEEGHGSKSAKKFLSKYLKDMYKNDKNSFYAYNTTRSIGRNSRGEVKNKISNNSDYRHNYSRFVTPDENGEMPDIDTLVLEDLYGNTNSNTRIHARADYNTLKESRSASAKLKVSDYGKWYEKLGLDKTELGKMMEETVAKMGESVSGIMHGFMEKDAKLVLDEVGKGFKELAGKAKRFFFGEKDDEGKYKNGLLSDIVNDTKAKFSEIGTTIKDGVMLRLFGMKKDENGEYVKDTENKGILSFVTDAITTGINGWTDTFFGTGDDDREDVQESIIDYMKKAAPNAAVGAAAGAGLSIMTGGSLLGTLVGGPILGAGLGAAVGFMSKSSKFQEVMFGTDDEYDEQGNLTKLGKNGLISKKVQNWFKDNKELAAGAATVGAGAGLLTGGGFLGTLVGGPIAGALLGLAGAVATKSNIFQKFLYGDIEEGGDQKGLINGIKSAWAKAFEKTNGANAELLASGTQALGMMATGAAAGGVVGALLGGPVVGAVAGLALSIKAQTSNLKEFFFGKEDGINWIDENGDVQTAKKQGVLGLIGGAIKTNILEPMKTEVVYAGKTFMNTLQHKILAPVAFLGEYIAGKAGEIVSGAADLAKNTFGGIYNIVKGAASSLLEPMSKAVGEIASGITNATTKVFDAIVKTPGTLIEGFLTAAGIREWFGELKPVQWIKDTASMIGRAIQTGINEVFNLIGKVIASPFKLLGKAVNGVVGLVGDTTRVIGTSFVHVAEGLGLGDVVSAMKRKWNTRDSKDGQKGDLSLWDRMRLSKEEYKQNKKEIDAQRKTNKRHDDNAKLIRRLTKGQFTEDTDEARSYIKYHDPKAYANHFTDPTNTSITQESMMIGKNLDKWDSASFDDKLLTPEQMAAKYSRKIYMHLEEMAKGANKIFGGTKRGTGATEVDQRVLRNARDLSRDEKVERAKKLNLAINYNTATDEELAQAIAEAESGMDYRTSGLFDNLYKSVQSTMNYIVHGNNRGGEGRGRRRLGGRGILSTIGSSIGRTVSGIGSSILGTAGNMISGAASDGLNWATNKIMPKIGKMFSNIGKSVFNVDFGNLAKGAQTALTTGLIASLLMKSGAATRKARANGGAIPGIGSSESTGDVSSNGVAEANTAQDEEQAEETDAKLADANKDIGNAKDAKERQKAIDRRNDLIEEQRRHRIDVLSDKTKENAKDSYKLQQEDAAEKAAKEAQKAQKAQLDAMNAQRESMEEFHGDWAKTFSIKDGLITGALIAALPAILKLLGGFFGGFSGSSGGDTPYVDYGANTGGNRDRWNKEHNASTNGRTPWENFKNNISQLLQGNLLALDRDYNPTQQTNARTRLLLNALGSSLLGVNFGSLGWYANKITGGLWNSFKNFGKSGLSGAVWKAFKEKHPILSLPGTLLGKTREGMVNLGEGVANVGRSIKNAYVNGLNLPSAPSEFDIFSKGAIGLNEADLANSNIANINKILGEGSTLNRTKGGLFMSADDVARLEAELGKDEAKQLLKSEGIRVASTEAKTTTLQKIFGRGAKASGTAAAETGVAAAEAAELASAKYAGTAYRDLAGSISKNADDLAKLKNAGYHISKSGKSILDASGKQVSTKNIMNALDNSIDDGAKVITQAANAVDDEVFKQCTKSIDDVTKVVEKRFKFPFKTPGNIIKALKTGWHKFAEQVTIKIAEITGINLAVDTVSGGLKEAIFALIGALDGGSVIGTARLFHINKENVDGTMRLIAGVFGALAGTTPGAIFDVLLQFAGSNTGHDYLFEWAVELYKGIKGEQSEEVKKFNDSSASFEKQWEENRRKELEPQYRALIEAGLIDKSLSYEEYIKKVEKGELGAAYQGFEDYNATQNATFLDKTGSALGKGLGWVHNNITNPAWQLLFGGKEVLTDDKGNTYTRNSDGTYKMTTASGTVSNIHASMLPDMLKASKSTGFLHQAFGGADSEIIRYRRSDGTYTTSKDGGSNGSASFDMGTSSYGLTDEQLSRVRSDQLNDSARQTQLLLEIRDGILGDNTYDYYQNSANWADDYDSYDDWYEDQEWTVGGGGNRRRRRRRRGRGGRGKERWLNGGSYFSQNDPDWKNDAYGMDGSTMGDSGCGPTAMAMAINTAEARGRGGRGVTPGMMATLAEAGGYRDATGTNADFIGASANAMGMNSEEVVMPDAGDLASQLSSGNPVVLLGHTGGNGKRRRGRGGRGDSLFTSGGHYVVATDYDPDTGSVSINDPNGTSTSGNYNINDIANDVDSSWTIGNGGYGSKTVSFRRAGKQFGGRGFDTSKWLEIVKAVKKAFANSGSEYHQDNSHDILISVGGKSLRARPDCSGFVCACLYYYGVIGSSQRMTSQNFNNGATSTLINAGFSSRPWGGWNDCHSGDILARSGHVCIFAGLVDGVPYVFNAGSTSAIQNPNATKNGSKTYTTVWSPGAPGSGSIGNFDVKSDDSKGNRTRKSGNTRNVRSGNNVDITFSEEQTPAADETFMGKLNNHITNTFTKAIDRFLGGNGRRRLGGRGKWTATGFDTGQITLTNGLNTETFSNLRPSGGFKFENEAELKNWMFNHGQDIESIGVAGMDVDLYEDTDEKPQMRQMVNYINNMSDSEWEALQAQRDSAHFIGNTLDESAQFWDSISPYVSVGKSSAWMYSYNKDTNQYIVYDRTKQYDDVFYVDAGKYKNSSEFIDRLNSRFSSPLYNTDQAEAINSVLGNTVKKRIPWSNMSQVDIIRYLSGGDNPDLATSNTIDASPAGEWALQQQQMKDVEKNKILAESKAKRAELSTHNWTVENINGTYKIYDKLGHEDKYYVIDGNISLGDKSASSTGTDPFNIFGTQSSLPRSESSGVFGNKLALSAGLGGDQSVKDIETKLAMLNVPFTEKYNSLEPWDNSHSWTISYNPENSTFLVWDKFGDKNSFVLDAKSIKTEKNLQNLEFELSKNPRMNVNEVKRLIQNTTKVDHGGVPYYDNSGHLLGKSALLSQNSSIMDTIYAKKSASGSTSDWISTLGSKHKTADVLSPDWQVFAMKDSENKPIYVLRDVNNVYPDDIWTFDASGDTTSVDIQNAINNLKLRDHTRNAATRTDKQIENLKSSNRKKLLKVIKNYGGTQASYPDLYRNANYKEGSSTKLTYVDGLDSERAQMLDTVTGKSTNKTIHWEVSQGNDGNFYIEDSNGNDKARYIIRNLDPRTNKPFFDSAASFQKSLNNFGYSSKSAGDLEGYFRQILGDKSSGIWEPIQASDSQAFVLGGEKYGADSAVSRDNDVYYTPDGKMYMRTTRKDGSVVYRSDGSEYSEKGLESALKNNLIFAKKYKGEDCYYYEGSDGLYYVYDENGNPINLRSTTKLGKNTNFISKSKFEEYYRSNRKITQVLNNKEYKNSRIDYTSHAPKKVKQMIDTEKIITGSGGSSFIEIVKFVKKSVADSFNNVTSNYKSSENENAGKNNSSIHSGNHGYVGAKGGRGRLRNLIGGRGTTAQEIDYAKKKVDGLKLLYNDKPATYKSSNGSKAFIIAAIELMTGRTPAASAFTDTGSNTYKSSENENAGKNNSSIHSGNHGYVAKRDGNGGGGRKIGGRDGDKPGMVYSNNQGISEKTSTSKTSTSNKGAGLGSYGFEYMEWPGWESLKAGDILVTETGGNVAVFSSKHNTFRGDNSSLKVASASADILEKYDIVWRPTQSGPAVSKGSSKSSGITSGIPSSSFGDASVNNNTATHSGDNTSYSDDTGSPETSNTDNGMSLWERLTGFMSGFFSGAVNAVGEKIATGKADKGWIKKLYEEYVPGMSSTVHSAVNKVSNLFGDETSSDSSTTEGKPHGESGSEPTVAAANVTPNDMASAAWKYLKNKGLSNGAVAGILGNMQIESGMVPGNLNDGANSSLGVSDEEYVRKVDSGEFNGTEKGAFGLVQWLGGRKQNLVSLAKSTGRSIGDSNAQLDYLWQELNGSEKATLAALQANPNVSASEAASIFYKKFERPGSEDTSLGKRQSYAQGYYNSFAADQAKDDYYYNESIRTGNPDNPNNDTGNGGGGMGKLKRRLGGRGLKAGAKIANRNVFIGGRAGDLNALRSQRPDNSGILRNNSQLIGSNNIEHQETKVPSEFLHVTGNASDRELVYQMVSLLSNIAASNVNADTKLSYLKEIYGILGGENQNGISSSVKSMSDKMTNLVDALAGGGKKDESAAKTNQKSEESSGEGGNGSRRRGGRGKKSEWEPYPMYFHRDKADSSLNIHNSLFDNGDRQADLARRIASGNGA